MGEGMLNQMRAQNKATTAFLTKMLAESESSEKADKKKRRNLVASSRMSTSSDSSSVKVLNNMGGLRPNRRRDVIYWFLQTIYPKDFRFTPREWSLPRETEIFKQDFKQGSTYILKPSSGSQGMGISVVQSWEAVVAYLSESPRSEHVAQEYIANPMLLDGYKFDLRVYVLLESLTPLKAYVFRDGLARLCTEKYAAPSSGNLNNTFVHLTNYHLNKDSENFKNADTFDQMTKSSKRSIRTALHQLKSQNNDFRSDRFWAEVDDIVAKTLISIWPSLWSSYIRVFNEYKYLHLYWIGYQQTRRYAHKTQNASKCWVSFDILLDSRNKAWLLEVNAAPSFNTGSALDDYLKVSLVESSLFAMRYISNADVERAKTLQKQHQLKRALKSQMSLLRWRERRARRLMLKSQFYERDFLAKKRSELDDIRTEIKKTGKLQLQAEQDLRDFLREARRQQGDGLMSGLNLPKTQTESTRLRPKTSEGDSSTLLSSSRNNRLLFPQVVKDWKMTSGGEDSNNSGREEEEEQEVEEQEDDEKEQEEKNKTGAATAGIEGGGTAARNVNQQQKQQKKKGYFPKNFKALKHVRLLPFEHNPHLALFASPVLQMLYYACLTEKGLSSSKFVRVLKHYGILTGDTSRARASLAFIQNLKPRRADSLDSARGRSGLRAMSFTEFCQTVLLIAQKRFPGRRPFKTLRLLLKLVHIGLVKEFKQEKGGLRRRAAKGSRK
eukprot:jgi/Bigna1/143465/aug1.79_g18173